MTTLQGFGAFISPLHPPGTDPTWLMAEDLALVEYLDGLGLDEVWVGEHHSGGWGTVSSPEVFLAAAAERTRHVRLGTGVTSLPYHNPYMVASRIVQLDHMTRGRVLLGVGAGSLPSDAHMLGIEPQQQRPRLAEALPAVLHLLRSDEPLTLRTDWFDLRDARLHLRPYQRDMEVAISSATSPFSMRLAGRHGLSPLSFAAAVPGTDPGNLARQWVHAEDAAAASGHRVHRENWRLVISVHLAATREQAVAEARPGHTRWLHGYFGDLLGLPVTPDGVEPGRELEATIDAGGAIIGSPEDCISAIERLQDVTGGFGRLLVTVQDWATPSQVRRSFELLATRVVPHFSGALRRIDASRSWVTATRGELVPKAFTALAEASAAPAPAATYPPTPNRLEPDPDWEWRRRETMQRVPMPFGGEAWLATRLDDVRTVFADRRFSRAAAVAEGAPRFFPHQPPADAILSMDPPDHTRIRRLVSAVFGTRRVQHLRPRIQEVADALLDDMVARDRVADLVEDFSLPLSVTVICELLGVPADDRPRFARWSQAVLSTTAIGADETATLQRELHDYLGELVARHRAAPGDDLLSRLATGAEGDALGESELQRLGESILIAGHETTASQIPNFVLTLLQHPEQMAKLRAQTELVPDAVLELLRFVPIGAVDGMPRVATEDVELAGVVVRAGEAVLPSMGAANRDGAVFDDPDVLDVTRRPSGHVAFGHGPHHCLGAPLALVELEVALTTLLTRLPGLRLAVSEDELIWKDGLIVRGMQAMPVTW